MGGLGQRSRGNGGANGGATEAASGWRRRARAPACALRHRCRRRPGGAGRRAGGGGPQRGSGAGTSAHHGAHQLGPECLQLPSACRALTSWRGGGNAQERAGAGGGTPPAAADALLGALAAVAGARRVCAGRASAVERRRWAGRGAALAAASARPAAAARRPRRLQPPPAARSRNCRRLGAGTGAGPWSSTCAAGTTQARIGGRPAPSALAAPLFPAPPRIPRPSPSAAARRRAPQAAAQTASRAPHDALLGGADHRAGPGRRSRRRARGCAWAGQPRRPGRAARSKGVQGRPPPPAACRRQPGTAKPLAAGAPAAPTCSPAQRGRPPALVLPAARSLARRPPPRGATAAQPPASPALPPPFHHVRGAQAAAAGGGRGGARDWVCARPAWRRAGRRGAAGAAAGRCPLPARLLHAPHSPLRPPAATLTHRAPCCSRGHPSWSPASWWRPPPSPPAPPAPRAACCRCAGCSWSGAGGCMARDWLPTLRRLLSPHPTAGDGAAGGCRARRRGGHKRGGQPPERDCRLRPPPGAGAFA